MPVVVASAPVDNAKPLPRGSLRVFAMPTSRLKRRPSRRLGAALAAAGALALVLTGCVGGATPTSSPTPTEAAPIFASDEEALAAAVSAYELYLMASAEDHKDGGRASPERIEPVRDRPDTSEESSTAEQFMRGRAHDHGVRKLFRSRIAAIDQHVERRDSDHHMFATT